MEGRPRAVLVGKYKNIRNSYYGNIKYNTKVEYNTYIMASRTCKVFVLNQQHDRGLSNKT